MSRMKQKYNDITPALREECGIKNVMQTPKLEKIIISVGAGEEGKDNKLIANMVDTISLIAGQKAVPTKAKISVSNFKLREGMTIGSRVTLRKDRMMEFMDRLVNVTLPRVRDFRGVNDKSFDGRGNYTMGVTEQIVFPEINYDKIDKIRGMDITIVTTAKTDEEAKALLLGFNIPFYN